MTSTEYRAISKTGAQSPVYTSLNLAESWPYHPDNLDRIEQRTVSDWEVYTPPKPDPYVIITVHHPAATITTWINDGKGKYKATAARDETLTYSELNTAYLITQRIPYPTQDNT